MVAVDMLDDAGYEVIEAESGEDAVAVLDGTKAIVGLFTDVQMPCAIDGFALTKIARERFPEVAIVVVSGAARPGKGDLPTRAAFLNKPYSCRTAVKTLDGLLHRK